MFSIDSRRLTSYIIRLRPTYYERFLWTNFLGFSKNWNSSTIKLFTFVSLSLFLCKVADTSVIKIDSFSVPCQLNCSKSYTEILLKNSILKTNKLFFLKLLQFLLHVSKVSLNGRRDKAYLIFRLLHRYHQKNNCITWKGIYINMNTPFSFKQIYIFRIYFTGGNVIQQG